jgi:integrase
VIPCIRLGKSGMPRYSPAALERWALVASDYDHPKEDVDGEEGTRKRVRVVPDDVRRLTRRLIADGLSPTTVRYSLTVLRMALKQAVDDGLIARNVAAAVQAPKVVRQGVGSMSIADARRMLEAAVDDPLGALWISGLVTGLRQGELLGLRWSDVDLDAGIVRVTGGLRPIPLEFREGGPRLQRVGTKTGKSRVSVLPPFAVDRLTALRDAAAGQQLRNLEGYVFTTPRGTPLDGRNVYREWHRFLADNGLPELCFHDLRRSTGTVLRALGVSIDDIRQIYGHVDDAQSWSYTDVQPEVLARVRNAWQEGLA